MRLDIFLYERGVYPSREKAKQAIESERVMVDGKVIKKPSFECEANVNVIAKPFEFVSRGGFKLQKAIEEFQINLKGAVVLDIGASTGGFTDVCLQNGAKKVYAVDTGVGQLASKLCQDKRVVNFEKTNYLTFSKENFSDANFVVIDVSFVSLTKFADKLSQDFERINIIALIKPQFEVGVNYAKTHQGIVKDEKLHKKIVEDISRFYQNKGFKINGIITSPIKGGDGNTEFLIWIEK